MRKTWTQLKNETMSREDQEQAHLLAMGDLAEMELTELREALNVSQTELAKKLKVTQAAISRLEHRPNILLETIHNYIEALGGRLELHAVIGDRTVKLTHLLSRKQAAERKIRQASVVDLMAALKHSLQSKQTARASRKDRTAKRSAAHGHS